MTEHQHEELRRLFDLVIDLPALGRDLNTDGKALQEYLSDLDPNAVPEN